MSAGLPTVSVVICCYTEHRWQDVVEAIKSLGEQTLAPSEVLLVVDHNEELLRRACGAFDGIRVLANSHRRGLSGARNTGVEAATGVIVAFLDDDASSDPEWLATMLAPYRDPDVAAVGGTAVPVWPDGRAPALLPAELYWIIGCGFTGQPARLAEVRNLMGCAMSFRRDLVLRLGGFAEQVGRTAALPLGCEETELCIRLRQRVPGAKVLLQPAATVRHRVSADRVSWRYLRRRSWAEGLSKAAVSTLVGQRDALSTERSYVRSVIPLALVRELTASLRGRSGRGRAAALAAAGGLLLATASAGAGYVAGRLRGAIDRANGARVNGVRVNDGAADPSRAPGGGRGSAPSFVPTTVCVVDVHKGHDVPGELRAVVGEAPGAGDILALVRSGRVTLGAARVGARDKDQYAARITELMDKRPWPEAPPRPTIMPRVSVVLATAGPVEHARRCVRSLLDTDYPDFEILVVDNRLGRPRPELIELASIDARIRYLREPVPGASRARNLGAREATGDVLAFTDDDAVVHADWLAELVAELAAGGSAHRPDCVTGLVMPLHLHTEAQAWFESFGGFGKGYRRRAYGPGHPAPDALYPLSPGIFGSGNNMAWRRQSFLDIGGFDERLGPGTRTRAGEDLDLFVKLMTAGGRLTYTPNAVVWHEHRATLPQLRRQLRGYGTGLAAVFLVHAARPGGLGGIARRLPRGAARLLHPASGRNTGRGTGYPRSLVLDELRGIALAPVAVLVESIRHGRRG